MSAVTVAVLDDAWTALRAERTGRARRQALADYRSLRGKAPWLVRVGHDLRRWWRR